MAVMGGGLAEGGVVGVGVMVGGRGAGGGAEGAEACWGEGEF